MPSMQAKQFKERSTRQHISQLESVVANVRALEVWNLRSSGMRLETIAKKLGISMACVQGDIKKAAGEIKARYLADAETNFEQALAQIDAVLAATTKRINQSMETRLDTSSLDRDLAEGTMKAFVVERYYRNGRVNKKVLQEDIENYSPELLAVERYLREGRLDLLAVEAFRKASESKRKLLGLDRDKQRIELSGSVSGPPVPTEDITDKIAEIAERHRKAREITVPAKPVKGAS